VRHEFDAEQLHRQVHLPGHDAAFPHLTVVDVTAFDVDLMNQAMTQYAIRPRDALHFAAMQRVACFDLASHDHHFDRIPQAGELDDNWEQARGVPSTPACPICLSMIESFQSTAYGMRKAGRL